MEIRFTPEHEWVRLEGNLATVGISDHAQRTLGDVVFIELPEVGSEIRKGDVAGTVESVKAVSELYAPLSGTIVEANIAVTANPAMVNEDPLGTGWLFKIAARDLTEFEGLLNESAYSALTS
jgi:glycine cleavage system H protein